MSIVSEKIKLAPIPALIRHLGLVPFEPTYQAMQHFTEARSKETLDELWLLQHPPTYTLGQAGKPEHLLKTGIIPIYPIDRGGQITYHGPGQLIVYILMDIKRRKWGVKKLVQALEQSVIDYLASQHIHGKRRDKAPGIYVDGRKISALGLRIRHGCCYHGLSLNIKMDLTPFLGINPCGYADLKVTQLYDLGISDDFSKVSTQFLPYLLNTLNYSQCLLGRDSIQGFFKKTLAS
jgi:lipoyl(octanoyl) transferase